MNWIGSRIRLKLKTRTSEAKEEKEEEKDEMVVPVVEEEVWEWDARVTAPSGKVSGVSCEAVHFSFKIRLIFQSHFPVIKLEQD